MTYKNCMYCGGPANHWGLCEINGLHCREKQKYYKLYAFAESLSRECAGETVGDTVKRLAKNISKVKNLEQCATTEDWQVWLDELGDELNDLAQVFKDIKE